MPIYHYHCKACDVHSEQVLKMKDYLLPCELPCSSCGALEIEKFIDAPRLIDPTKLMGVGKRIDGDFRSLLENIKKTTYKSEFDIR